SVIPLPNAAAPPTGPPVTSLAPVEPVQPQAPIITVTTMAAPSVPWQPPILGSLAVIFGVASLFTGTLVLPPLALLPALAAGQSSVRAPRRSAAGPRPPWRLRPPSISGPCWGSPG